MADVNQPPKDLIGLLDFYLVKKAPFQVPDNVREWLVKFGPWIALVLMIVTLPLVLLAFGISTVFLPFAGAGYAAGFGLSTILAIVQFGLQVAALPGLFARKMSGWTLLFYAQLVWILAALLTGWIVHALLGGLISLYLLFQVRSLYRT